MTTATITLNPGTGGDKPLVDTLTTVDGAAAPAGASVQFVKVGHGAASDFKTASAANPFPVSGTFFQTTQPVSGPATDAQLRTTPLPVSMSNTLALTDAQLRATPVPITMSNTLALTDTQLRATPVPINGAVSVTANGIISTVNSTAVALAANAVFTGPAEDITEFADVRLLVFADQPSAVDGLQLQQSSNGTNWDSVDAFTLPATTGRPFSVGASARFFRVVYTNGATAQTAFRLQTKLYKAYGKGASVRPQDARSNENDFEENLAFGMGYNGVSWDRLRSTVANGLAVDVTRIADQRASPLHITATALVNVGATATLPAPAAGLFHYITSIQLVKLYAALGVASAAGVVITSTNLPGGFAWTTEQQGSAAGAAPQVIDYQPTTPLKASAAAVATTLVAPAQLQTIWRWNVSYFTAA